MSIPGVRSGACASCWFVSQADKCEYNSKSNFTILTYVYESLQRFAAICKWFTSFAYFCKCKLFANGYIALYAIANAIEALTNIFLASNHSTTAPAAPTAPAASAASTASTASTALVSPSLRPSKRHHVALPTTPSPPPPPPRPHLYNA